MPILFISTILGAFFLLLGTISWLFLRLLRRPYSTRSIAQKTFFAYLVSLPLFIFLVLPLLFSWMIANASTRPQDREITLTPATYEALFENVDFPSRDGLNLSGWYLPGAAEPAFTFAHGLFRNRQEVLERACRLNAAGHPVLLFDFRSHGESAPSAITLGYRERLDVLGAKDFLLQRTGHEVILAGVSMGAVASILAAAQEPEAVAGLIADSPFSNLRSTVARHTDLFLGLPSFPFVNLFVWNFSRIGGFDPHLLNSRQALSHITKRPILLIYGEEDRRMPLEVAQELYRAAPSDRKKLVTFPQARHGRAYRADPERYLKELTTFLQHQVDLVEPGGTLQ